MKEVSSTDVSSEFAKSIRDINCFALIRSLSAVPRHYLEVDPTNTATRELSPWVIAGLVRESLIRSNPNRGRVQVYFQDVLHLSNLYQNLDTQRPNHIPFPDHIFAISAIEQFPSQESEFEELARFLIIYGGTETIEQEIVNRTFESSFGMSVQDFANLTVIFYSIALLNHGVIPLTPGPAIQIDDFVDDFDLDVYRKYLWRVSINRTGFLKDFEGTRKSLRGNALKYEPNPFMNFPILELNKGEYLAPLPRLILRQSTHAIVYKGCFDVDGETYTSAIGKVFERYLGRQLDLLDNKKLYSPIKWEKSKTLYESTDWILVTTEYVVIVESKSTKLPSLSTRGESELFDYAHERVSESVIQINRTYREIMDGNPDFYHIPSNLPIFGVIATPENLRITNLPHVRSSINCEIPYLTMSFREIEQSVPMDANSWAKGLYEIATDDEKKHWMVISAMPSDFGADRNPILDAAADKLRVFANSILDRGN